MMKKFLTVIFIITILGTLTGCGDSKPTQKSETKLVEKAMSLTKEQADSVVNVFYDCGIKDIKEIKYEAGLDNVHGVGVKGYRLQTSNAQKITVYIKDGKVLYIGGSLGGEIRELYRNEQVLAQVSDYTFTLKEMTDYQLKCKKGVSTMLKAPKSAEFPSLSEWAFSKDKERIIVQSYVDAQNSFGAQIRSRFQITFSPDGKNITSFIFEGKEYIK